MVGGGNCCLCILYGFDAGSGVLEMDIEDKENEAVFEKAAFEKAVGEGLINGVYIDIDARLTAEKHKQKRNSRNQSVF